MITNYLINCFKNIINNPNYTTIFVCSLTIIFTWIIIPWWNNKRKIKNFIEYFVIKNNVKLNGKKTIFDSLQLHYLLTNNLKPIANSCFKFGLSTKEVLNYINDKSTVPLRIKFPQIYFPFKNDIFCILYKARKQIIFSIFLICYIVIDKFIL